MNNDNELIGRDIIPHEVADLHYSYEYFNVIISFTKEMKHLCGGALITTLHAITVNECVALFEILSSVRAVTLYKTAKNVVRTASYNVKDEKSIDHTTKLSLVTVSSFTLDLSF